MSTVFPVRLAWYLVAVFAGGLLLYPVAPVLTPFLLSAVLACICVPPVDRIARKLPRWPAAALGLLVMLLMATYYAAALWFAGLEYALPIGIVAGALVFVPYLGVLVGVLLGTLAGFNQFGRLFGFFGVLLALPANAALLVALRHLQARYVDSDLYKS